MNEDPLAPARGVINGLAITAAVLLLLWLLVGCAQTELVADTPDRTIAASWQSGGDVNRVYTDCRAGEGEFTNTGTEQGGATVANLQGCLMYIETTDASQLAPTVGNVLRAIIGVP